MTENKKLALETLENIKKIYNESESDLLCGILWSDFMNTINEQIDFIKSYTK